MNHAETFKGKFTLVAWGYHHGADGTAGHDDCKRYFDIAKDIGVDVLIDHHIHADEIHNRKMKMLIMASVSPDNPADPMGPIHWGSPAVDEPQAGRDAWNAVRGPVDGCGRLKSGKPWPKLEKSVYGNISQLAWYEKHFGKHPAVIGYCLNDSCRPCVENVIAARWLKTKAPDKIRYVSYGDPQTQNGSLFHVTSFLNFAFTMDATPGRSRHETFKKVVTTGAKLSREHGCKLYWPIIPASCPDRFLTTEEMQYQIKTVQDTGADGCVLFPFGPHFNEFVPTKYNGHIGATIKAAAKAAKAVRIQGT